MTLISHHQDLMICGKFTDPGCPEFENGCFVAGTPVWTDKGLVPIEQLKVGDMVLSKPENGTGEQAYKRVVNTFVHEDKDVWFFQYYDLDTVNPSYIYATPNHPIWVKGKGWTSIDSMTSGQEVIELEDGREAGVGVVAPVYATVKQNNGFRIFGDDSIREKMGECIDFSMSPYLHDEGYQPFTGRNLTADNLHVLDQEHRLLTFKRRVFNIEVEDFHTYYVGEPGVWVFNRNCEKDEVPTASHFVATNN